MSFKPVIFLAFANNKVDNAQYLRNLSLEQRGIRTALSEAVSKGLCEVIERSSSTISDIIDVFQDPIYGPRISIFHYGGHADGFSLLLESEDGSKALTHKEGLVPFFARQENLKLIFLNGCSSEGQATDLLKSGIPAVIGTTASINDEIATSLATRFYSSLGDGSSIEKAWADATDEVKIKNGTGNTRALYWPGKQEVNDRFPWVIQFKPGAEIIKEWNLPDISGNPLYGLPVIPQSYNLPESPFLYLNRYERKHAEVFFGRSYYVRSLFSSVADSQGPPIILLCGQSGTGKSSLLEAGLQPRLESRYEIIYLRRNGAIGLSATLFNALIEKCGFKPEVSVITETKSFSELDNLKQFVANLSDSIKSELQPIIEKLSSSSKNNVPVTTIQDQKPSSLPAAWHLVEQKLGKPLLVILDQLEEAYTRPNTSLGNEMNQLFLHLKAVFGNPASLPKGKILLSYRKEYQPEIEEYCKKYELSRSKVFIEHISKNDIVKLFQEFMTSPRLMSRYHLTVENGLPELIAEDLAADKEAPVAPVLQILLTKMWKKAVDLHPEAPVFTHELYHELKEQGLAMDEFLQNQMQAIKKKLPEAHDLGFVLDMLAFHCTANNTSAARTEKELLAHYPFAIDSAKKVLAACKDSFLITDLGGNEHSSMLAHDTLAKSVVKAQQRSTQPIQQGKRILSSRIEAIKAGSEFATMDSWELKLIEKIQTYLPAFDEGEKKLFESSRKEIDKQERQRRRIVNSRRIIIAISILSGIVAWYLYAQSKKHEKASFVSLMTVSSGMNIEKDPTMAITQALSGLEKDSNSLELKKMLLRAYYYSEENKLAWYNIIYKSDKQITNLIYNSRVNLMIPNSSSDTLDIISEEGKMNGN
ncbi:MAG: CHAT domain-containing protein [Saprospiraceae bacterium]|nr:CHAT domain-containing protein [Saprospiraceae bacterium]